MTRLRGRALKGERLIEKVPHGHWQTTTLIAALNCQGICCATTVDGAINGELFVGFVEQVLVPKLKPGQYVIMDNLSSHKVVGVSEAIEGAGGHVLYLPPYSPDLNPIEMAFSKIKQLMRSARHRIIDALWDDTQRILDKVTASDATGYFRHCGYTLGNN